MDFYWAITKHLSDSLSSHEIHVSVTSIINGISHKNALLIHECCTEFCKCTTCMCQYYNREIIGTVILGDRHGLEVDFSFLWCIL